jgi:hypothetical protein
VNANLAFDDTAVAIGTTVVSGTFRPTNIGTTDVFPAPAPAGPFGATLSVFNGVNPNGTWSLFVADDVGADAGSISGGWSLNFISDLPVCCEQACTLTCPADLTRPNDPGACGALVSYSAPTVSGTCGVVACVPPSGSFFPVGMTTVTCTATRQDGSQTSCTFKVTVEDRESPLISNASASPSSLWPPNHKMEDVAINYTTADNCTPSGSIVCTLSVTSNEPVEGGGDGDTSPDWEVIDAHNVRLRAERSGGGNGRIYTITIRCTDAAGNVTTQTVTVTVPHDQGS